MDLLLVNLKLFGAIDNDISALNEYVELAQSALGAPKPYNYPMFGDDAFRTATGVHAAAIIKAKKKGDDWLADRVYSGVPAAMVGREQEIESGSCQAPQRLVVAGHREVPADRPGQAIHHQTARTSASCGQILYVCAVGAPPARFDRAPGGGAAGGDNHRRPHQPRPRRKSTGCARSRAPSVRLAPRQDRAARRGAAVAAFMLDLKPARTSPADREWNRKDGARLGTLRIVESPADGRRATDRRRCARAPSPGPTSVNGPGATHRSARAPLRTDTIPCTPRDRHGGRPVVGRLAPPFTTLDETGRSGHELTARSCWERRARWGRRSGDLGRRRDSRPRTPSGGGRGQCGVAGTRRKLLWSSRLAIQERNQPRQARGQMYAAARGNGPARRPARPRASEVRPRGAAGRSLSSSICGYARARRDRPRIPVAAIRVRGRPLAR
jgi:hypothetical protein